MKLGTMMEMVMMMVEEWESRDDDGGRRGPQNGAGCCGCAVRRACCKIGWLSITAARRHLFFR
ncbi:hypothetical protein Dda_2837 [Drechslerella dactyloides]|uniref:Uncharacterized protein n=1 Tax=Drechslerella dactyloides TaxID=74499 RepID=A0AAD6J2I9_DREDA|nr:hypothetical protein Dda_2837 [Drechslerella dactyloides]